MVQSPSWEANWFAASQEIPRISRNPMVHYRTHKRPPPVPTLGQPNPVHIPTSHVLEILIHPSTPRSPQWSPSLRFPHQDPIHPLSSPVSTICPAHIILLDFITRTVLGEEYRSFSSSSYEHITKEKIMSNSTHSRVAEFIHFVWEYMRVRELGEFALGWNDITTMDQKEI